MMMQNSKSNDNGIIYAIAHNGNIIYVGQTTDLTKRQKQHIKDLQAGKHIKTLQKYFNDNVKGINNLEFRVLHECKDQSKIRMFMAELVLITLRKPLNKPIYQIGTYFMNFGFPDVPFNEEILRYL